MKTSKTKNSKLKLVIKIIVVFIILAILLACGIGGYFLIQSRKPVFELNGSNVCSVQLNEEYKEQGAYAKYKGEDVSNEVKITYHHETKDGEVVDKIKTETETVYFAEYSISIEDWTPNNIFRQINVGTDPISITFLELGNFHTGDSTYIKAGETDILIDAGSNQSSVSAIETFMNSKMSDKKIEYVIATHAHMDHIGAFVGNKTTGGILDHYKVGTLIQFSNITKETEIYKSYASKVETLKANGTKVYDAATLINEKKNVFELAENISFTVLDQKYYHQASSNENNHSVCTLFTQGNNNYLFTGDLEADGESSLVDLNPNLPHCQLFKGGHHGSDTANSDKLLNKITPETVCICTCVGSDEYRAKPENIFPAQGTCDRIRKHTDKIYCTGSKIGEEYAPMNGTITFKCENGSDYTVHGSNNDTLLVDTDWFKTNRMHT